MPRFHALVFYILITAVLVLCNGCKPAVTDNTEDIPADVFMETQSDNLINRALREKMTEGEIDVDEGILPEVKINLCAFGDILVHNGTYNAARIGETYDFDYMFRDVARYFENADYTVGNLETVFAGKENVFSNYPLFNSPEQIGESLARVLGVDLLSTANNHCLDRGITGLESTLDFLDSFGIAHTGTYRNEEESGSIFIADVKDVKLAFLSYTYGVNVEIPNDYSVNIISKEALQSNAFAARKSGADYIVALLHWGNEYQRFASNEQRELAGWLFENTEIDLIIGNHPHVTQPIEELKVTYNGREKTGYVFYALGNFTGEQFYDYTDSGIITNINIIIDRDDYTKNRVESITYTPVFIDPNPKETGKRYRLISVSDAIYGYESGTDTLISAKEYKKLCGYINDYKDLLCSYEIISEFK